jgi:hypothetical protein
MPKCIVRRDANSWIGRGMPRLGTPLAAPAGRTREQAMSNAGVASNVRSWMEQCVRLVLLRVPFVGRRDAMTCAEEMQRTWPDARPEEAVTRYFEDPRFEPTDWSVFELK